MRAGWVVLMVVVACSSNDGKGPPAGGPSLTVHVIKRFPGCYTAYVSAVFPPSDTPLMQTVDCRTFDSGNADVVIPYPTGTTAGSGTVDFHGEDWSPGRDGGSAEFTIVDPNMSATVELQVCYFLGIDGGPTYCYP
jgi:hypothetical protein